MSDKAAATRLREALASLLAKADAGEEVTISVAAVCRVANLSRTAAYKYGPGVIEEIKKVNRPPKKISARELRMKRLSEENAALSETVRALVSQNAVLLFRASQAEERLGRELRSAPKHDRKNAR